MSQPVELYEAITELIRRRLRLRRLPQRWTVHPVRRDQDGCHHSAILTDHHHVTLFFYPGFLRVYGAQEDTLELDYGDPRLAELVVDSFLEWV